MDKNENYIKGKYFENYVASLYESMGFIGTIKLLPGRLPGSMRGCFSGGKKRKQDLP
jgi:hypothetical protein